MPNPHYIVYSDGGSRGNPGPAAWGYAICDAADSVIVEAGKTMGKTTNNVAEYTGAIEGLRALRAHIGKKQAKEVSVEVRMDSELVVKQMNGVYKVKGENMAPLFIALWNLRPDFEWVRFVHVPRAQNTRADAMVNEALDKEQGGLSL